MQRRVIRASRFLRLQHVDERRFERSVSKRYDEAIEVAPDASPTPGRAELPVAFSWRGRRYEIDQHLSSWREGAEWWHGRGSNGSNRTGRVAQDRDCLRVLARPAGVFATGDLDPDGFMAPAPSAVYDLAFDRISKTWRLCRVWD